MTSIEGVGLRPNRNRCRKFRVILPRVAPLCILQTQQISETWVDAGGDYVKITDTTVVPDVTEA